MKATALVFLPLGRSVDFQHPSVRQAREDSSPFFASHALSLQLKLLSLGKAIFAAEVTPAFSSVLTEIAQVFDHH